MILPILLLAHLQNNFNATFKEKVIVCATISRVLDNEMTLRVRLINNTKDTIRYFDFTCSDAYYSIESKNWSIKRMPCYKNTRMVYTLNPFQIHEQIIHLEISPSIPRAFIRPACP